MTRILLVDDDPAQLKLLARVIATRQPGLSVVTANSGSGAIEQLRAMPVDLVLTDLQMPDTNGFSLVAWLLSHQPHVQVFTMTAYPDDEAVERLRALGSVECYTKPLDVANVLERVSNALEQGMRGHVRNISLPSLLQLIEMERKTCTLTVESGGRTGYLYISDGTLVDARYDEERGESAAIEVARWSSPAVTIVNTCATRRHTVQRPMGFIIMEAVRLTDEAARITPQPLEPAELPSNEDFLDLGPGTPTPDAPVFSLRSVSHFPVSLPTTANAIAIVEAASGRIRASAGHFDELETLAQLVAQVFCKETATVRQLSSDEAIQELLITTGRYWAMLRPLATQPASLVLVVFDPERANVVMERLELDSFVVALQAWSMMQQQSEGGH